jgi:acyl carrier protein
VLGLDRVGIDDDFFDLGGHSLLATQVIAQVQSTCGVLVPLNVLFVGPTVAQLAAQVEQARAQSPAGTSSEDDMERLLADLEQLSDEEAQRLLASERQSRKEA